MTKLLAELGEACADYQDRTLRDLPCTAIEVDEIWSFCYSKQKNVPTEHKGEFGYGDVWTWTAICADTKLIASWHVGDRTVEDGWTFMADLKGRLRNRIQLTTDGHASHSAAIGLTFGCDVDWAILERTMRRTRARNAAIAQPYARP